MQCIALWEGSVGGNDVIIILCNGLSDWISEYDAFHTFLVFHCTRGRLIQLNDPLVNGNSRCKKHDSFPRVE
jgi:hypothetical protein